MIPAKERREEEKKKLLGLNEIEAEKLSIPERYQRMRYQREDEANLWVEEIRRNLPPPKKNYSPHTKYVKSYKRTGED